MIKQTIKDWYSTAILIAIMNGVLFIFTPELKVNILVAANCLVFAFTGGLLIGRWTLKEELKKKQ